MPAGKVPGSRARVGQAGVPDVSLRQIIAGCAAAARAPRKAFSRDRRARPWPAAAGGTRPAAGRDDDRPAGGGDLAGGRLVS
jgi:hypothetical protein